MMNDDWAQLQKILRQEPSETETPWPEPVEYTEFKKLPVSKPKPIIDNILDDSSRMIIGGASKTYKSWVMIEQAICIACGAPWWGFQTHQANVLYVNFELKPYYAKRRFTSIEESKGLRITPARLHIWNLWNETVPLVRFESGLIRLIEAHTITVVFIDPFYCLLGENDERVSAELMPVLSMFSRVNRSTAASIVCAAHFTKGNQASKDPIDRISGGASMGRNPECLMILTRHKTEHAFTVDWIVRDFEPINPFVVSWDHPLLIRTDLDPEDIKRPELRSHNYSKNQILDVLADCDDTFSTTTALQKKVHQETGMRSSTFYSLFAQLKIEKRVFRSKLSGNWNLKP